MSQTFKPFLLPLLGGFALMLLLVHARDDQSGLISIDCGLAGNSSYAEKTTGINYISDETFIDTGERKSILPEYSNRYQQPYTSLRSFPEGKRNCYEINVTDGCKYLIRSSFVYGNYDGQNKVPKFDLHLGANLWSMVKLGSSGVPFISALEIRPLLNGSYITEGESLALDMGFDRGQNANLTSYT
ncbi:unnamed protein product [Prunus armeniaca]|uniref:Malectin-like domain-containing protein n=1 Tax=Prunus armeniaca TaxID=36596 RepID=A0A6J5XNI6_PRUAR|nr:unnamed protein product [Prunus armeniaca]